MLVIWLSSYLYEVTVMSIQVQQVTAAVALEADIGIARRCRVLRVLCKSNAHTSILDSFIQAVLVPLIIDAILAKVLHHQLYKDLFTHATECCPVLRQTCIT